MNKFKIGDDYIGQNEPPYFIADIAANHDGDLDRAFKLIELAKGAGAHAAKFQNFVADKIVSRKGFDKLGAQLSHQSNWKKSVYETYEDASISFSWTEKLKAKCDEVGITYFTSPYDFESVDYVDPYLPAYKIGSGDITWHGIINHIAKKGKPVMLATGASTIDDVKMAMNILESYTKNLVLMQCNTNYTADYENFKYINLNVLKTYKRLFPHTVLGLSDHTYGHATVVGAISMGARVIEKHFTDDNNRDGPDHKFSMNPKTWKSMVENSNEVFLALGKEEKQIEPNEKETSRLQRRALRLTKNLNSGHILESSDLFPLRPYENEGFAPYEIKKLLGKKIKYDLIKDSLLRKEDII